MLDNIVNWMVGTVIALGLYLYCDVPVEEALTVGYVAVIAYALSDISRHLRKGSR